MPESSALATIHVVEPVYLGLEVKRYLRLNVIVGPLLIFLARYRLEKELLR